MGPQTCSEEREGFEEARKGKRAICFGGKWECAIIWIHIHGAVQKNEERYINAVNITIRHYPKSHILANIK